MTELLMIYLCSNNLSGCAQSQQTYLHYHPEINQIARKVTDRVPKVIAKDIGPILALAYKKEFTFTIVEHSSVTISLQEVTSKVTFTFGF